MAVHPLDVTQAVLLPHPQMAAAENDQVLAVMGGRPEAGRIEQGPDPAEVEDWTVEDIAEQRLLDRLTLVGALPEGRQGPLETDPAGPAAHAAEELHELHGWLIEQDLGGRGDRHGGLLGRE